MLQGPSQRDPTHLKETRMGFTERPVDFPVVAAPGKRKQLWRQRGGGAGREFVSAWTAATCAVASDQNPKRKQVSPSAAAQQPPTITDECGNFLGPWPPRDNIRCLTGVSVPIAVWGDINSGLRGAAAVLIAGSHAERNVNLQLHRRQRGVLICCVIVLERHQRTSEVTSGFIINFLKDKQHSLISIHFYSLLCWLLLYFLELFSPVGAALVVLALLYQQSQQRIHWVSDTLYI